MPPNDNYIFCTPRLFKNELQQLELLGHRAVVHLQ